MANAKKKTKKKAAKKVAKRKQGQPTKHTKAMDVQVRLLAEKGLTDREIGEVFDVTETTVNNWKKQFPCFFESLKAGKKIADNKVVMALFQRACGYSHPEVHISCSQGSVIKTNIIKHYAPDTTACIFWLKNRDKKNWRDKQETSHTLSPETATLLGIIDGGNKGKLPNTAEIEEVR